jgi:adenine-specific DNA glycosylase
LKIEAQLMALVPRERWTRTTDLLIFHGRKICDARRPACGTCPLFPLCRWESRQAWATGKPPAPGRTKGVRSGPRAAQRPSRSAARAKTRPPARTPRARVRPSRKGRGR